MARWLIRWLASHWVAMLLLALYLVQLSAAPLFDVDEGAFAEASREMLVSGDWGHTTLNGTDRFDKPIFIYWCQAGFMYLLGTHDWVARLPSAFAVLGALISVWQFATRQWGRDAGQRAAFMLGTSFGLLAIGRAATADGMLNALLIATSLSLWNFVATGSQKSLRWAYFWCALGLLTKGPVAALVPGASLLIWSILTDRGRTAWKAFWMPSGWSILVMIAFPWYLYAFNRHGDAFINGFFLKHNVERFTSTLEGHQGNLFYYLAVLPLLILPWTPFCAPLLLRVRKQLADPLLKFLWIWLLFVLCFFSTSSTKLPHYMLYGLTPLVLLIVAHITHKPISPVINAWLASFATLSCLLVGLLPTFVAKVAAVVQDPWIRGLLITAPDGEPLIFFSALVLVLGIGLFRQHQLTAWQRIVVYVWAVCMLWVCFAIPWVSQVLQSPFKEVSTWARTHHPNVHIVQWRMHQPSFAFYYGDTTPQISPSPEDWIIVRSDRVDGLHLEQYEVAHSYRGLLLLNPKK